MGLGITWYRGLTRLGVRDADTEPDDDAGEFDIYPNGEDFSEHATDVPPGRYKAEEEDGFSAGPYSAYSRWRNELARLAGYPAADPSTLDKEHRNYAEVYPFSTAAWAVDGTETLPFYRLVFFSDCEGTIGTDVSAQLAKDFAAFQEKADTHPDEWFRRKYGEWRNAFEKASDRGAVCFH